MPAYFSNRVYLLSTYGNLHLQTLFAGMKVIEVVELGLGANAVLSDIHRLQWNTTTTASGEPSTANIAIW